MAAENGQDLGNRAYIHARKMSSFVDDSGQISTALSQNVYPFLESSTYSS